MSIDTWDEIRTAYHVARIGTVSGAAEALGVHHATVIRHVDALEGRLGVKLFQRHARGYTPTEAGEDLLKVAQTTDEQFGQLAGRIRGRGDAVTGDLVVTSIGSFGGRLTRALVDFQQDHPGLTVRLLTDPRLFRLEYGEAHVAIRAGTAPGQADNIVQPFLSVDYALYASESYVRRHGLPGSEADLAAHLFVGPDSDGSPAPFLRWLATTVPRDRVAFRSASPEVMQEAVLAGAGIGFWPVWQAQETSGLVQVMPPRPEWAPPLWLVTHMDLHRTAKVQAVLKHLKAAGKSWTDG
jgi:DNA-binding transcriptional LysR family regulator